MAPVCTSCGFENPPGMRFCGNCGSRLGGAAAPLPAAGQDSTRSLAELKERYRAAGIEAAGQRRDVTVLFADLSGYTSLAERLDNEDVYFLIQEYTRLLAEIVYRYDGYVDKYTGDGLMALFGAPIMQEQNAELAVRAAMEMHSEMAKLSSRLPGRAGLELYMRIGLHSGSVVVGGVGSELQMNYTAIGDVVNLAARLEQAARPGTILVSESVYAATRVLFDFTRLPPMTLKGISNLVQTYQVSGVKERPGIVRGLEGMRSPMVGRESELGRLKETLALLCERKRGSLVFITGEAGLGKTRLVSELKALVPPEQAQIFEGHSLTYRRTVSYWIFLDLLRNVLGVTPYMPEAGVQQRLQQRIQRILGERAGDVLPLLERVMNLKSSNPAANERLSQLEADQLRQRTFLAFRDWLVAEAGRQPLLLVLEDLHWADDASLDLLRFLAGSVQDEPLLIYVTSRPLQEGPLFELAARSRRRLGDQFLMIQLQSLSPDQSAQLLDQLLVMLTLPAPLRHEIVQRADGNPFYLEEILRMLIDRGIITRKDGELRLVPGVDLSNLGVPETLKGLILARFDRLDQPERQFLQVAAAIGRSFSLALVKTVLNLPGDQALNATVGTLIEREFIRPVPDVPGGEYQFQHILVSDAIYSTLLTRSRADLHGRIGEAIELVYSDHLDEQVDLLARHYAWSNRRDRALYYLIRAAHNAAATFLNKQAQQYYQDALELLAEVAHTPEQVFEIHNGLGDALLFLGDYSGAREHFQAALGQAGGLVEAEQVQARSSVQRKIGATYERQGDYEQAMTCLNDALASLTAISSRYPVERARVLNDIGYIFFRRAQLDEAEKYLQRALGSVDPSSQPGVVSSIYNRLGGVYFTREDLKTASEYARKSLDLRIETGDMAGVARMHNNLGMLEMRQGNWDEALQNYLRGVELNAELNDVEATTELRLNIGVLLTEKGDLEEGRWHLEECLRAGQQIGHSFLEGQACQNLSYNFLQDRQYNRALEYAQRGEVIFRDVSGAENLIDLSLIKGEAYLGQSDFTRAQESLREMLARVDERGDDPGAILQRARADRLAGKIAYRQGQFEAARELLDRSAGKFTLMKTPLDLGRALAVQAALARETGDLAAAGSETSQARAIFAQLGARLDLAELDGTF